MTAPADLATVVGGVSEGAALAVLAASAPESHTWVNEPLRTLREPLERAVVILADVLVIPSSNHRFTDNMPKLKKQILAGLAWLKSGS